MSEVRLYRPANGCEGDEFQAAFCNRCACDPEDLEESEHDGCPILAATMAFAVDAPEYPTQWRWSAGNPTCTAFVARPQNWDGVPRDPYRCERQLAAYSALARDPLTGRPVID